jgi:hypothetical protein
MTADLKERFQKFVRTLDGFEDIDALLKDRDPAGKKRADYLFSERTIIVEQKVLETNPSEKTQNYLGRLMGGKSDHRVGNVCLRQRRLLRAAGRREAVQKSTS